MSRGRSLQHAWPSPEGLHPPHCLLCDQFVELGGRAKFESLSQGLCVDCIESINQEPTNPCLRCSSPIDEAAGAEMSSESFDRDSDEPDGCRTCDAWPPARSFCRSLCLSGFDGSLRDAIHALKVQGHRRIGRFLGDALARRFPEVAGWSGLMPVPLHPARRRERGFNQAELIARGMAARSKTTLYSKCFFALGPPLSRPVRPVPTSEKLTSRALSSLKRALENLDCEWCPVGGTVGLVDDALTMGATLDACGQAILRVRPDIDLVAVVAVVAVVAGIAVREIDSGIDPSVGPTRALG